MSINIIAVCIIYCHLFWMSVWNWAVLFCLVVSQSAVDLNMCVSAYTRGRARVVSDHLHFFLFRAAATATSAALQYNTHIYSHYNVCTKCRNFAIRFSESAVFFQHFELIINIHTHTHTRKHTNLQCLRVSVCRADAFFSALTFFSYFFFGGFSLSAWFYSPNSYSLFVFACVYLCLYAHSFGFYWVNLDFERIPFGFNTFVFICSFRSPLGLNRMKKKEKKQQQQNSLPTATARPV